MTAKKEPITKRPSKKRTPQPLDRSRTYRAARRVNVLQQCLEADYNPVDGIIKTRKQVNEIVEELESFLRRGGPAPWYVGMALASDGERNQLERQQSSARNMLFKFREYGVEIDEAILPYCHPKLKASEDEPAEPETSVQVQIQAGDDPKKAAASYRELIKAVRNTK